MRAIRAHLPKVVVPPAILALAAAVALAGSSVPAAADPIPANEVLSFMMSATETNTTITFQHAGSIVGASGEFALLNCVNCVTITPNPLEFDLSTAVIDLTMAAPTETATFAGNMPLSLTQLGFITEITQQGIFDLPGFSPTDAGIKVLFNSFTDTADIGLSTDATVNVAPAPLIGRGLPAILAVGGLLVLTELAPSSAPASAWEPPQRAGQQRCYGEPARVAIRASMLASWRLPRPCRGWPRSNFFAAKPSGTDDHVQQSRSGGMSFMAPTISVVIPTHNRPDTVARLLLCIKRQSYTDFECLVIDDGSNDNTIAQYNAIWKTLDDRFLLHLKTKDERGGGPGKTRNAGIRHARGTFIAFCDDDDLWIRDDHLSSSVAALTKYDADLFFANMQLSTNGRLVNPNWFSVAPNSLWQCPLPGENDIFQVSSRDIGRFLIHRTLHADTLVVDKDLMMRSGMYYEREIFGEDYDINFRLIDNAKKIILRSTVVADLNVSDHPSFIRSYQTRERVLLTILAALRAETDVVDAGLRRVARANRAWFMLELAQLMLQEHRSRETFELATQGFLMRPSMEAVRLIGRTLFGR